MDTETLIKSLRELVIANLDWTFTLYNTTKGRDGQELEFSCCKMQGLGVWLETLKTAVLEKGIGERSVTAYSPFLSKDVIGAVERDNDMIRERLFDVLASVEHAHTYKPDDYLSAVLPMPKGYGFYGSAKDPDGNILTQVLFLRRSNPFITGERTLLCKAKGDEIIKNEDALLKFAPSVDFIMIGDICYFFSAAIEKDFGFEKRDYAFCARRLKTISDAGIVNYYDQLEKVAYSAKNAKKFIDFDIEILHHISDMPTLERTEWLSKFGIETDSEGRINTTDPDQCELIIDLLCCRSCLDVFGRLAVGSNITPRE